MRMEQAVSLFSFVSPAREHAVLQALLGWGLFVLLCV